MMVKEASLKNNERYKKLKDPKVDVLGDKEEAKAVLSIE